ncbi:MAG: 4-hydroxybenzoate octaprenyltransferase [Kiloniellales bacterium]
MTAARKTTASDIRTDHWSLRLAPAAARPYLRLVRFDRPIGTWLLLLPCWWSLALAAAATGQPPDFRLALLFAIGALVMRGAGCTVNDLADRDFDARVARTAGRPIPSGQISVRRAVVFLVLQLAAGLMILVQLHPFAILLGVGALPLIFAYPFMKRFTWWPQAWLGLTFNWGALMGWAAVTGGLDWPPVLLYAAGIFWTLGYDTIYAHQDKEDDALIGVKSSALRLGTRTRPALAVFYAAATVLMAAAGLAAGLGWAYLLALAVVAGLFVWQVAGLDIDDPDDCLRRFKSNRYAGLFLLAGLLAEVALAPPTGA